MEVESDYEDEDVPVLDKDGNFKPRKKRMRQYNKDSKGPFVVYIRVIDDHTSLKSMKISKFIFGTCKSHVTIRQVNANKMRVQFSSNTDTVESLDEARREANALPMCEWNKKYHIYIPEKMVEVMGCIAWSTHENTDELTKAGEGKFKNSHLPNVKILDAVRFMKKTDEASATPQLLKTNIVRVTFDGLILPEQINLYGLLIPVREFKRRQMFCDKCLSYNHTKAHCNNKPAQQISTPTPSCLQCQGEHKSGDKNCPRRKFLEKRDNDRDKTVQQKTYAEMLRQFDPDALMPGETDGEIPSLDLGTKKDRQHKLPANEQSTSTESQVRKKIRVNITSTETPPGFNNNIVEENDVTAFVNSFLNEMELPPFIIQLFNKFIMPLIQKFTKNITNSFMQKLSSLSQ